MGSRYNYTIPGPGHQQLHLVPLLRERFEVWSLQRRSLATQHPRDDSLTPDLAVSQSWEYCEWESGKQADEKYSIILCNITLNYIVIIP